jgi:RimJ/RimL family protein N-acetyltransferase
VVFSFLDEKVKLRPFEAQDAPHLEQYLNHPAISGRRYLPWKYPETAPLSMEVVNQIINDWQAFEQGFHLAVISSPADRIVGHVNVDWGWDAHCPSVSLVISPEYQRQRFGSSTLNIVLHYLFSETPAHTVGSEWVADWNEPAKRFLLKNGFTLNGTIRWAGMHGGKPFDMHAADILRREWQTRPGGEHAAGG